jgi:TetR/AcrR family transcriptional regulator
MAEPLRAAQRMVRQAARRAESRTDILDAAERVFSEDGLRDGSMRRIADLSGYSTAAIYLFFESKQHLLAETLNRRADEYLEAMRRAAAGDATPIQLLHQIVDVSAAFFVERPEFRRLLRQLQGGAAIVGPVLDAFAADVYGRYAEVMSIMAGLVSDGQGAGEVRAGNAEALAHFASVLTNEYVLSESVTGDSALTGQQFHDLFDGALRPTAPSRSRRKPR